MSWDETIAALLEKPTLTAVEHNLLSTRGKAIPFAHSSRATCRWRSRNHPAYLACAWWRVRKSVMPCQPSNSSTTGIYKPVKYRWLVAGVHYRQHLAPQNRNHEPPLWSMLEDRLCSAPNMMRIMASSCGMATVSKVRAMIERPPSFRTRRVRRPLLARWVGALDEGGGMVYKKATIQ